MKIFLVGYRATGKTTVARLLAQSLGLAFVDLDHLIEERAGITIKEIVARYGWSVFRAQERQALLEMVCLPQGVAVACGGGAVLHRDLWPEIRSRGLVVWLKASPETIYQRLVADEKTATQRPSLTNHRDLMNEIRETLAERLPLYQEVAHWAIDTEGRSPEEVRDAILARLKNSRFVPEPLNPEGLPGQKGP